MALNRYEFTKKDVQDKFTTSRLPSIPQSSDDRYIFSREGDRLDQIAYEFYQEARYWWIIAVANNLGKGTLSVKPGIQLRIPASTQFTNTN
mgnify:CR=1 FL=1